MDDQLSIPTALSSRDADASSESGGEDEMPDYRQLSVFAKAFAGGKKGADVAIPKRGEKEFEPTGLRIQEKALNEAREAMFGALRGERKGSSKNTSIGLWSSALARATVLVQRGSHFNTLGHPVRSVPERLSFSTSSAAPVVKVASETRLDLLPEEALYLIERGSLLCYKDEAGTLQGLGGPGEGEESKVQGRAVMSVQQAFAEMIGKEGLTLERYQVYANLKRLGYIILRAQPPPSVLRAYPHYSALAPVPRPSTRPSLLHRLVLAPLRSLLASFENVFARLRGIIPLISDKGQWKFYDDLFRCLRLIPSSHDLPLHVPVPDPSAEPEYPIFWHAWKPSTKFRKTDPGPPDFQIVVVNARTSPVPSLPQFAELFSTLPPATLPPPRRPPKNPPIPTPATSAPRSLFAQLFGLLGEKEREEREKAEKERERERERAMFPWLKQGRRTAVFAVVDAGTTSWLRFGEGDFAGWGLFG